MPPDMTGAYDRAVIYHIAAAADWAKAKAEGEYAISTRGVTLAQQGYLHASSAEQVADVANAFYHDAPDLVLLVIDEARVAPEIRYEDVPGQTHPYPHIYGPLDVDAVVDVLPFAPGPDGRFRFTPP